jgi:hypothetical protein
MANKSEINKMLFAMSALPNCPIRNDNIEYVIDAYHFVLKDFDWDTLQAAAAQYLSNGTFFPAPGQLRQTVIEMRLSASGIPTAAEAWADVQGAVRQVEAVYCPEGCRLRKRALDADKAHDGAGYNAALNQIIGHSRTCTGCRDAQTVEVYRHPVVEQTVRRLGGRAALFTDNLAADRARFIEAYEAILGMERKEAGRLPEVTVWMDDERAALETGGRAEVKRLIESMTR